ncbi:MAG: amino acid/amide transporter rane protein 2, family / amino acid/amide transporter, partial [Frankiales bacterium]|nr:amino acid/amide transporter rane protein 2, family / amino acid/amide transporter [Frankiales bacterium]
IGMLGAFTYWQLTVSWGWPIWLALPTVLVVLAPLLGAGVERALIRPLHGASVDITLVVTLGLLLFMLGTADYVWDQGQSRVLPEFFASHKPLRIAGVNITIGQALIVVVAFAVAIGLRFLFSATRIGIAMRGVVDDPDLCAMAGASPARIQQLSWAIGASLAALAGILIAPKVGLSAVQLTLLVINGYAAALFGRLKSLPRTAVGALILGLIVNYYPVYVSPHLPKSWQETGTQLTGAVPMIFLAVLLLFIPAARLRTAATAGRVAPTVPGLRQSLVGGGGLVVLALGLAATLSASNLRIGSGVFILALASLSLVLLTGYSGQTSLCVLTFLGVGAFAMAHTNNVMGLVYGGLAAALLGMLVALATARLRGLYLALATFAFAKGMDEAFFGFHLGSGQALNVKRFRLPLVDTGSEGTFFVVTALIFAIAAIGILAVRRGRWGRQLTALNDSPAACATLGLNTTITKVVIFSVTAGMAGVAGGLFGARQGIITPQDFTVLGSLALLLALRIGGINTITGALFGAFTIAMFPVIKEHIHGLPDNVQLDFLLTGLAALSIGRDPDGIGGRVSKLGARLRARGLLDVLDPPVTASAPRAEEAQLVHS